jgi:hypothetical protein
MNTFLEGDKVRSKAVGRKEAFDGVIEEVGSCYFNVRCPKGALWHRTQSELTLIESAALTSDKP